MNIDKFGHHVHKRLRIFDVLDFTNKSLTTGEDGSYDIQHKQMKGIRSPEADDEAVNKEYVDKITRNLCNNEDVEKITSAVIKKEMSDLNTQLNFKLALLKQEIITYISLNTKHDEKRRS